MLSRTSEFRGYNRQRNKLQYKHNTYIYIRVCVHVRARACVRIRVYEEPIWLAPQTPPRCVGAIFPPNCESMQIIPVESSIKRRFYLKGGGGRGESGRLMHRIGKRARAIFIKLFRVPRYTYRNRNCDWTRKNANNAGGNIDKSPFHRIDIHIYIFFLKPPLNILRVSK